MGRLRWRGSLDAQSGADEAFRRLKPRRKQVARRKRWVKYSDYLESKHWLARRKQKLQSSKYTCERCGSKRRLEVHHKHYRTLWQEKNSDLEVLCRNCHALQHEDKGATDEMTREFTNRVKKY